MQTTATAATSGSSSGEIAKEATKSLGKNEFLKLLLAQLQNQDPTKPMDNQAFVAQLAQFSSLEQLQALGEKFDMMTVAQASTNQLQVAGLVGKQVEFRTDALHLAGKPLEVKGNLSLDADSVVAVVTDASGATVRTLTLGAQGAGAFSFSWDGRSESGAALPAGDYQVAIHAGRKDGSTVQGELYTRGVVDAVTFDTDSPVLLIGTLRVKLSEVSQVSNPSVAGG
jgi:flagellar basal-body rod modification protein FlgD